MLCLRDGAGDHDRHNRRLLLSLQRSPTPAINSILPVALHRGSGGLSAAALAHSTLEPVAGWDFTESFHFLSNRAGASTVYVIMCEVFK